MKCVYRAESLVDARIYADCLEGNGVPCEIFGENAVGALGELPVMGPEVWIRRDLDLERAEDLVAMLTHSMNQSDPAGNQACPHCDESNPASFEICWNCNRSL